MKKHYISLIFLLVVLILITSCSIGKSEFKETQDETQKDDNQSEVQGVDNKTRPWVDDGFVEVDLSELKIGEQVVVMGSENSDGTVLASRIMIGMEETDSAELGGGIRFQQEGETDESRIRPQMPQMPEGQSPNFERFQNMSEEEREKFREEMMARREGGEMIRTNNRMQGMTRVSGEVIVKDEASITVKLEEGGSKLIFLSEETEIVELKE